MIQDYRQFQVGPDPYGRTWNIKYLWQQTAISIRHSDSVDVKFALDDGEQSEEKVIAMMHPQLLALAAKRDGRKINDAWCMKLAALHLKRMIATGEDMEKSLVTMSAADLEKSGAELEASRTAA